MQGGRESRDPGDSRAEEAGGHDNNSEKHHEVSREAQRQREDPIGAGAEANISDLPDAARWVRGRDAAVSGHCYQQHV